MFNNIERKIKALAKVLTWIGIIGSIGGGMYFIKEGMDMRRGGETYIAIGVGVIVFGSLMSWISSWVFYGFGELIEYSKKIAENTSHKESV